MSAVSKSVFLAIAGGIVASDAILLRPDGEVLAHVDGPGSSVKHVGFDGALDALEQMRTRAMAAADLPEDTVPARVTAFMAGIDLPAERERIRAQLSARLPGASVVAENDTHAVLWAGLRRPAGAALICGEGINAIARSSTGKTAGYLAFGTISGEWGGGLQLGREVLYAASRAEDGRGAQTSLRYRVAAHFRRPTVREALEDLAQAPSIESALADLLPVLFDADSANDPVARYLVDRLSAEIVGMVRAALDRVGVPSSGSDVVLGGHVLTRGYPRLDSLLDDGFAQSLPGAAVRRLDLPLVVGAALACIGADRGGPVPDEKYVGRILQTLQTADPAEPIEASAVH